MIRFCVLVLLSFNLLCVLCKHNVSSGQFLQNERFNERRDYGHNENVRNNTRYGHNLVKHNNTQIRHQNSRMNWESHRNNTRRMDHKMYSNKGEHYPSNNPISYNASYPHINNSRILGHKYDHHNIPIGNHYNTSKHGPQYSLHRNNSRLMDYRQYQNHNVQRYDHQGYQSDQPHGHHGNRHQDNHHDKHKNRPHHNQNMQHHQFDHKFNPNNSTHQNLNALNQTNSHHPSVPNIFGNNPSNNHHAVNLTEEQRAALTQQFLEMTKEFPLITAPQRSCPDGFRKDRNGACREIF